MTVPASRKIPSGLGWLRRLIFYYIAMTMVTLEGLFLLNGIFGIDFSPRILIWAIPLVSPLSLALLAIAFERNREGIKEPSTWPRWAFLGLVMFAIWAGVYLLVGRYTDPARVHILSTALEDRIPLKPSYSLLYLLLYPIFILPFFVVRDPNVLQRLVVADLLMFAVCSLLFLGFPVAFPRPSLPFPPPDFGHWLLAVIYGSDPAWNCLPSEHCMAAMIATLAILETNRKIGVFSMIATLSIGVSTLFTKQHYIIDVVVGYGLAVAVSLAVRWARVGDLFRAAWINLSEIAAGIRDK